MLKRHFRFISILQMVAIGLCFLVHINETLAEDATKPQRSAITKFEQTQKNLKEIAMAALLLYADTEKYPANGPVTLETFHVTPDTSLFVKLSKTKKQSYLFQSNGKENFVVSDISSYAPKLLRKFIHGGVPENGVSLKIGNFCAYSCWHIGYNNQVGFFGY